MSPDEIGIIVTTWSCASTEPDGITPAITDRLPRTLLAPATRARWIVRAVSRLSVVLDHPALFVPLAGDLLAERIPVTIEELEFEREALLEALADVLGPLGPEVERAWRLAIGLFAEIVSSVCLDPFGGGP